MKNIIFKRWGKRGEGKVINLRKYLSYTFTYKDIFSMESDRITQIYKEISTKLRSWNKYN